MTARTTATAKTTAPQFAAAWKLAHCHHHWWAVTAAPAVWALAAAAARATAALDAWAVEHWRDRGVMHIGGRLVAYDHRCRRSWRAPDHVTLARKMGLI